LGGGEFAGAYVLTKKEVRKLVKERGWELYHPVLIGGRTRGLKIQARRNRSIVPNPFYLPLYLLQLEDGYRPE